MKNWKTTLAGVLVAGLAIATSLGYINQSVAEAIGALAISLGLVVAKDHDVSGLVGGRPNDRG
jgi:hypothetical protein